MLSNFTNSLFLFLSLVTATGIVMHDTRVDKATTVAIVPPLAVGYEIGTKFLQSDPHTHVERGSIAQAMNVFHSTAPGIQPRTHDKKHLLQRTVPRGHHAFDNYNLPLI